MRRLLTVLVSVLALVVWPSMVVPAALGAEVAHDQVVSSDPLANTPHVLDGIVFAVAEVGSTIVLGGSFTQVQAASGGPVLTRNRLVAFDRNTGQISSSFAPDVNSTVRSVVPAADGASVYVGGQFGSVDGAGASKVVRLRTSDGSRVPGFTAPVIDRVVHDLKLVGDRLFVGGEFTRVANQDRTALAELDPGSGALRSSVDLEVAGTHRGGSTLVHKLDVAPDGETMVVTGNFSTIDGQDRVQVAMVDLSQTPAVLADWHTDRWKPNCYSSFEYYLNDLDFSPDGDYFVLSSMGGYGSGPPTLCDTISRWEADDRGASLDPTWVNYTGGDSVYAVEAAGDIIYHGGHHRWVNNPFGRDAAGQGAVEREGIGALNAVNGMPLSWDPGRTRGRGVFDLLASEQGLWVGSDTDRIAGYQYHGRIAMFPLAGGTEVPRPQAPELPVDVVQTGGSQELDGRYLYRVNAGGATVPSVDGGQDWLGDTSPPGSTYRNTGTSANGSLGGGVDATVPEGTPLSVFTSERWDPAPEPELHWSFPVPAGTDVQVRLYMADTCTCTPDPGSRVFDVTLDGDLVLDDLDLNAEVGHGVGTMRSFDVTSDGAVDIELLHGVENPLVNAIEIVDLDAAPPEEAPPGVVVPFDGDDAGEPEPLTLTGFSWGGVRGGFVAGDTLYTAMADGRMLETSFDGTSLGTPVELDLHGLTNFALEMQQMTGLFYSHGRIYFTLSGQSGLFMRYFEVESGTVGAQRFTVTGDVPDLAWGSTRGMFLAGDHIYAARTSGELVRVPWEQGVGNGAVAGPAQVVSGPADDDVDWAARSLIAMEGAELPPENVDPVAAFSVECSGLTCVFDGSGSSDADGEVVGYEWEVGGTTVSGAVHTFTFDSAGSHEVTLVVQDDRGGSGSVTQTVEVVAPQEPPVDSAVSFVGSDATSETGSSMVHSAQVPGGVQAGDLLVGVFSTNGVVEAVDGPAGWQASALTSTASLTSAIWTREAVAGDAGSTVSVQTPRYMRGNLVVAAYRGADVAAAEVVLEPETVSRSNHTTPAVLADAGDWVASYWADKTASTTQWQVPAGVQARETGAGPGAGHLSWLYGDSDGPVAAGAAGGLTAVADSATANAAMATIVLTPGDGTMAATQAAPVEDDAAAGEEPAAEEAEPVVEDGPAAEEAEPVAVEEAVAEEAVPATEDETGNEAPEALFSSECTDATCTFDGSGSSDADGEVVGYDWELAGATASGALHTLTFPADGAHEVTLTVVDDEGAEASVSHTVEVTAPSDEASGAEIEVVGSAASATNGVTTVHAVEIPEEVAAGDLLVVHVTTEGPSGEVGAPSGWRPAAMTSSSALTSAVWTRDATVSDAGATVEVRTPDRLRGSVVLTAYRGADLAASEILLETDGSERTTPAALVQEGDWVASSWVGRKTLPSVAWQAPDELVVRVTGAGSGRGHLTWLYGDSDGPLEGGDHAGLTATSEGATSSSAMATVVLAPTG